ncbi:MAG: 23S rRNA (adenine(2503)-C(2))-methyltransferase RlmN [Bacillota bacterium]
MIDLKDLTLSELEALTARYGEPRYRARQLAEWVFKRGALSLSEMTNLPAGFRERLAGEAVVGRLEVLDSRVSAAGDTTKYLFGLDDGHAVETVLMRHDYGRTVCVSSQVGCRMGCRFCASALGGWIRSLRSGEMYEQVLAVRRASGGPVTHVVLMGMGEPLDNYENTLKFVANVTAPYGLHLSQRRITLSTCGLVPEIRRLARERLALTLAISLHAPNNGLRDTLVPVNRKYPLEQLIPACADYARRTGRRVSFEYILLGGVNDSPELARELSGLLKGLLGHVNLIPANPVPESGYRAPSLEAVRTFRRVLEEGGVPVSLRRELGADIEAACGQLRRRYKE